MTSQQNSSGSIKKSQAQSGSLPTPTSPPTSLSVGLNSLRSQYLEWFRRYFRPHFDDWVFGPIDRLVHSKDALVGFIMMACAIDYLASFWWGSSTKRSVKKAYTGFIDEYFPSHRYDSEGLYDSLRNGLVHLFTIQGRKYALTHNQPNIHLGVDATRQIVLNAADFRDDLRMAKDKYFDDVESTPDLLDKLMERYFRDGFLDLERLTLPPSGSPMSGSINVTGSDVAWNGKHPNGAG